MVAWTDVLSGVAFREWLLEVASGSRVKRVPLDPFATSMRDFRNASEWLSLVEAGTDLPSRGGAGNQAQTDLKSAGLLVAEGASVSLSQLGENVLARWRENDIADDALESELARCLVVIQEAVGLGEERYREMLDFWLEIRDVLEASDVLSDVEALYSISYLNQSVDGFNPWDVLAVSEAEIEIDWDELAANIPDPDDDVTAAIETMKKRVADSASRGDGRIIFCTALETFCLASDDMEQAEAALHEWEVPQ